MDVEIAAILYPQVFQFHELSLRICLHQPPLELLFDQKFSTFASFWNTALGFKNNFSIFPSIFKRSISYSGDMTLHICQYVKRVSITNVEITRTIKKNSRWSTHQLRYDAPFFSIREQSRLRPSVLVVNQRFSNFLDDFSCCGRFWPSKTFSILSARPQSCFNSCK